MDAEERDFEREQQTGHYREMATWLAHELKSRGEFSGDEVALAFVLEEDVARLVSWRLSTMSTGVPIHELPTLEIAGSQGDLFATRGR